MNCLLFVVAVALCLNGANSLSNFRMLQFQRQFDIMKSSNSDSDMWIEQKLDNFRTSDTRTWMQRYFIQTLYFRPEGPVFLQIGGEGPANPIWMNTGHWITMAKQVGALCFMLEHRFYGKSRPTSNASTENLVFLSSEQALADIANFITMMTEKYSLQGRKWIVFGGSYSGALAVWFRLKYPHLASGAVSASAPLNALVDFSGYLEVVNNALTNYGSKTCSQNLESASLQIASNLKTSEGRKLLQTTFSLCEPLSDSGRDDENFQETLAGNVMGVVQYNRDNRGFEGALGSNITIETVCAIMDNSSLGGPFQRYAELNRVIMDAYQQSCLDASYDSYLASMRNVSWEGAIGGRQWVYQTCTEFGWYQTSDSKNQPFVGFPLKFAVNQCMSVFGVTEAQIADGVRRSNENYGSLGVANVVTNVTLYNGGVDPWSHVSYVNKMKGLNSIPLGLRGVLTMTRSNEESGIYSFFVPDTAHCAIQYPASPGDSPLLKQARIAVEGVVRDWLGISTRKIRLV